ncbi:GtrA family protein, partial [bacterium]|nr:GtrA family protein [bacterium]
MTEQPSSGDQITPLDRILAKIRSNRGMVRFIKFGLVGSLGVVVNLGVYTIFFQVLEFQDFLARMIAIEISILHNFTWNFSWTWRDRGRQISSIPARLLRYHGSTLISSYGVTLGIGWILMKILPDIFMA